MYTKKCFKVNTVQRTLHATKKLKQTLYGTSVCENKNITSYASCIRKSFDLCSRLSKTGHFLLGRDIHTRYNEMSKVPYLNDPRRYYHYYGIFFTHRILSFGMFVWVILTIFPPAGRHKVVVLDAQIYIYYIYIIRHKCESFFERRRVRLFYITTIPIRFINITVDRSV